MSTSPEAKQAAVWAGWPHGSDGHRPFCEGYDAATAKLREDLAAMQDEVLKRDARIAQLAHQPEQEYVHIERYFPKGYNPNDEPWLSIRKHYRTAEKQMAVLERMLSDKDKEWEAQPDSQQPIAPTPDVEKIARDVAHQLLRDNTETLGGHFENVSALTKALTQVQAPLVAALKHQRELWELAADQLNAYDDANGQVRFTQFHKPISALDAALTGTGEK